MSLHRLVAALDTAGGTLVRAWPRSAVHLQLEADVAGRAVAGQWFAEPRDAVRAAAGTPGSSLVGGELLLQPGGADRKLPRLAGWAAEPGAELVAHRPERRGVVRRTHAGRTVFTKVVRPAALDGVLASAEAAAALPLRTPEVVDVDRRGSAVTTAALPGRTLHDLLGTPAAVAACRGAGAALAALHAVPVPAGAAPHGAGEESAVLDRWLGLARVHGVPVADQDRPHLPRPPRQVLLHRDLHDKQLLVDEDGTVGVLDFDLLAVGDPALDLGNLLAHLDLRVAQDLLADAGPLRDAVLDGYAPDRALLTRLPAAERATRLRLAAVYSFRPRWTAAAATLLVRP